MKYKTQPNQKVHRYAKIRPNQFHSVIAINKRNNTSTSLTMTLMLLLMVRQKVDLLLLKPDPNPNLHPKAYQYFSMRIKCQMGHLCT